MVYSQYWVGVRLVIRKNVSVRRCDRRLAQEPARGLEQQISIFNEQQRQCEANEAFQSAAKQEYEDALIAAPRLNPGPVPKVSFPVPKGEPALGSSGYSDITLSTPALRTSAPSG